MYDDALLARVERGADDLVGLSDPTDAQTTADCPQFFIGGIRTTKAVGVERAANVPFTRMPRGPNSCEAAAVSALSPPSATAYTTVKGEG